MTTITRERTPSVNELRDFFLRAQEAGLISDLSITPPRDGVPGTKFEMIDKEGDHHFLKFMDAHAFAINLSGKMKDKEVRRVKAMSKPELVDYAEKNGIEILPGQTKPTILKAIIAHIEES